MQSDETGHSQTQPNTIKIPPNGTKTPPYTTKIPPNGTKCNQHTTKYDQNTTKWNQNTTKYDQNTIKGNQNTTKYHQNTTKWNQTPPNMTKILPNSTKHRMEEYKPYELWVGSSQPALCDKLQFNQFFSQTNLNFSERELGLISDEKKKNRDCDIVQDFTHPIAVFSI